MKKILTVALLVIAIVVFVISSMDGLTKPIANLRYSSMAWWGSEKYAYGDLYGFCYLPKFRIKDPQGIDNLKNADSVIKNNRNIDLYALSDSYTWSLFNKPALFQNVDHLKFVISNQNETMPVSLDKKKKNVLILESSERNIRALFEDTAYLKRIFRVNPDTDQTRKQPTTSSNTVHEKLSFKFKIKEIDPNIEFNLWDYRFLSPLKGFKANLNYRLFGRLNKDVYLSPDEKYLLYGPTIDTSSRESSFKPIGKKEVDFIINSLNASADYYKSKGFDEVYIAIIPNPVTVLFPGYQGHVYNQLIPLIQNNSNLKCKVINCFAMFKQHPAEQLYCASDTHWNYNGEKLWVELFNKTLNK